MERLIFSIDPTGFYIYFWLFVTIALILGLVVYLLLRRPQMRRTQFKNRSPVSKLWSALVAAAIALPLIGYAYADSWLHFYTVSMKDEKLYINYIFPKRTVEISNLNDLQVSTDSAIRKGVKYRIKLKTYSEKEYTSQLMNAEQLKVNLDKLNNSLKKMEQHNESPH
jgi:hypothetical protein